MFRPGRNAKEQAGNEHTSEQPQPSTSGFGNAPGGNTQDAPGQQSRTATDQPPATGARNMSETQPTTSRAFSESESLARDIKEGTLSGFVGNGTSLTGEANFKGMLRVDGHLSGKVSSQDGTLIVSTGGEVHADIAVSVAQIYGTVNGNITATKRIELGRVARVTGDIQTPALVIENGASFEGSCRMQQIKDAQAKEEARASASSAAPPAAAATTGGTSGAPKPDAAKPSDTATTTGGGTATPTTGATAKPASATT